MTLLERIAARQCAVVDCSEDRAPDSDVCAPDITAKWMHRLDRNPDGTYRRRHALRARDETWLGRAA